jgi:hypothetical protein
MTTYRLTCKDCGKSYQTDHKRGDAIAQLLVQDPDYLKNYKCRKCQKGIVEPKVEKPKTKSEAVKKVAKHTILVKHTIEVTEFDDEVKQFIPTECEPYVNRHFGTGKDKVMDEDVLAFHFKTKNRQLKNVLLIGETGTGKTLGVNHFCFKNKIPYFRVVMNGGTTPEDILGQNVMEGDGKIQFSYQVLVKMMKHGGIFVFDEINAGQKDILHILNSITDHERKAIVTQHKGEVIVASDKFLVIACMNPPAEYDLQEMSKSLKSRFCPYYFDYDDAVDKKVLNGDAKLLKFAKAVRTARVNKQIETPLSTRDLKQFQLIREGLGNMMAKEMLINKFHNGEKQVVKTIFETHMEKSNILDKEEKGDSQ